VFPAGLLSRFMSSPSNIHMGIAKRVLKYIRGTTNLGIWYLKTGGVKLIGYANSDWAGSVDDMKSTSGYFLTLVQVQSVRMQRSKRWWHNQLQKQSISPWQLL